MVWRPHLLGATEPVEGQEVSMLGGFQQEIPFDVILDSIDSAVILFDAETLQVLVANKRAEGAYGLAAGESVELILLGLGTSDVQLKRNVTVGGRRCSLLIIPDLIY